MQTAVVASQRLSLRVNRSVVRVTRIQSRTGLLIWDFRSQVVNVSLGGICLTAMTTASRGDQFDLVCTESRSPTPMHLQAEVRWRQGNRVGLRWINLTSDQRSWLASVIRFWVGEQGVRSRG